MHILYHIGAIIIVIAIGLFLMGRYSAKKDPTEREDAKVINLDEYEYKISGDDFPPLKKVQRN